MKKKVLPERSQIDEIATGINLKERIADAGYHVSDVQEYLYLSCPQPIYRWMSGKALPSLQHLCALSKLLGVPLDDLIVQRSAISCVNTKSEPPLWICIERPLGYDKILRNYHLFWNLCADEFDPCAGLQHLSFHS